MKQPSQLTPNIHKESLKTLSSMPFTIHSSGRAKSPREARWQPPSPTPKKGPWGQQWEKHTGKEARRSFKHSEVTRMSEIIKTQYIWFVSNTIFTVSKLYRLKMVDTQESERS